MNKALLAVLLVPALAAAQPVSSEPEGTAAEPQEADAQSPALGTGLNLLQPKGASVTREMTPEAMKLELELKSKGIDPSKLFPEMPSLKTDLAADPKTAEALKAAEGTAKAPEIADIHDKLLIDSFAESYGKDANLKANAANFAQGALEISKDAKAYFVDAQGKPIPKDSLALMSQVAGFCSDSQMRCVPANAGMMTSFQLLNFDKSAAGANAADTTANASTALGAPAGTLVGEGGKYKSYNDCISAGECMGPPAPEPATASAECPGPGGVPCSPEYLQELANKGRLPSAGAEQTLSLTGELPPNESSDPSPESREKSIMKSLQATAEATPERAPADSGSTPPPASFQSSGEFQPLSVDGDVRAPQGEAVVLRTQKDQEAYLASLEPEAPFDLDRRIDPEQTVAGAAARIGAQMNAPSGAGVGAIAQAKDASSVAKAAAGATPDNPEGAAALANAQAQGNRPDLPKTCVEKKAGLLGSPEIALSGSSDCPSTPKD